MITADQLSAIAHSIKGGRAIAISQHLNAICPLPVYGINTKDIFEEFIANLLEECNEFSRFEENLNYSGPRLMEVWPSRFKTLDYARQFAHNPKKLAEKVYNNRSDLGNGGINDGWNFRGGGPIQMTGRSNYTAFTDFYNNTFGTTYTVELMADLIRTNVEIGIHSACWLFAISKKLIQLAIDDNMIAIVKRINGGLTGLSQRTIYYTRAKAVLV